METRAAIPISYEDSSPVHWSSGDHEEFVRESFSPHTEGFMARPVVRSWERPLYIALVIIGILGVGIVGGVGLANLGHHLDWWQAAGFSGLNQTASIIITASGGVAGLLLIAVGGRGLFKKGDSLRDDSDFIDSDEEVGDYQPIEGRMTKKIEVATSWLKNNEFTWIPNEDGLLYTLLIRHKTTTSRGYEIEQSNNIPWKEVNKEARVIEGIVYTFAWTHPLPDELKFSVDELAPGTFTFACQTNGRYSLVIRPHNSAPFILAKNIRSNGSVLNAYVPSLLGGNLSFTETSLLPDGFKNPNAAQLDPESSDDVG